MGPYSSGCGRGGGRDGVGRRGLEWSEGVRGRGGGGQIVCHS